MNHKNSKFSRRSWTWVDTRTITLQVFADWKDFISFTGIENKVEYKKVFDYLCGMYGNIYTKPNTKELLGNRLRFYIENEVEKQLKQSEVWDNQIDRLMGSYENLNQYGVGGLKPDDVDNKNFDKYLFARQTKLKQDDILDKVKQLQEMKTPFESVISIIKEKLFIKWQKGLDEIIHIIGGEND